VTEFVPPAEIIRCPIDTALKIIGKKFTVLILRDMLFRNERRFNEFLHSVEGINPNTLAIRLREMERNGLVERRIFNESPVRIEYHLTEKGRDLLPILEQVSAFSMKHAPEIFADGKASSFQHVCGRKPCSF
jgi:DNA-binding HxlR family transcriptional regulator